MRGKRVLAVLLAGSFVFSMTGCKNIKSVNIDDFAAAWDDYGAEEIDIDDLTSYDSDFDDKLFDGIYCTFEPGDLDDSRYMIAALKMYKLDLNLDLDDVDQICVGVTAYHNLEEYSIDDVADLDDINIDFAGGIQLTLEESVDVDELADGIEDLLDFIDINPDDLSSSEYRTSKNGLSLMLRVSIADIASGVLDSDLLDIFGMRMEDDELDDFEDALENMEGDAYLYIVAEDENVVIMVGLGYNFPVQRLIEFTDAFGFEDPYRLTANQDIANGIVEAYEDRLSGTMAMIESYSEGAAVAEGG